jgi:hypothetical protein
MPRVNLRVPISEKDDAKRLGARWDPQQKLWYVPEGLDVVAFKPWLPVPFQPNIRAPCYHLATGTRHCWRCQATTRVFAIMLPAGYEDLFIAEDPDDDHWQVGDEPTVLSYVSGLDESVAARLRQLAPRYRVDYSQTTRSFYWMNHCEYCEAKLGDFETIQEFDSPFGSGADPGLTTRQDIAEPFAARCGGYTL